MRGPLLVVSVVAMGVALAWAQPAPRAKPTKSAPERPATGFDHIGHEGKVSVSGATPPPCTRCHNVRTDGRLLGTPGHRACFRDCHGKLPVRRRRGRAYPIAETRRRVCEACHRPAALARAITGSREKLSAAYPPYQIEPDYSITFPHDTHQDPAKAVGGCVACHATPPDPGRPAPTSTRAHARCATCHGKAGVSPMSACKTCHLPAFGPATSPHLVRGSFPVGPTFSHRKHAARVAASKSDPCADCHQGVAASSGDELPAPKTESCTGCHDGEKAFSTVEPACRRCHSSPPERTRRSPTKPAHYAHAAHRSRGVELPCEACHRTPKGAHASSTGLATPRHEPCAGSGCHAAEFVSTQPRICTVCHVGHEPWRKLHSEMPTTLRSEFGVPFDHRGHLGGDEPRLRVACDRCHRVGSRSRLTQPRDDHRGCSGSSCHDDSAKPPLSSCDACHRPGARETRRKLRAGAAYSVRERFDHRPHTRAPDSSALPCDRCHAGVLESSTLADIPAPKKAACASCHDGKAAFKMTGHGCRRCHGKL